MQFRNSTALPVMCRVGKTSEPPNSSYNEHLTCIDEGGINCVISCKCIKPKISEVKQVYKKPESFIEQLCVNKLIEEQSPNYRKRRRRRIANHSSTRWIPHLFNYSLKPIQDLLHLRGASFYFRVMLFLVLSALPSPTWGLEMPPRYSRDAMPNTSFTCDDKASGGYYADPEAECQMFHVCVRVSEEEVGGTIIETLHPCEDYKTVASIAVC